MTDLDVLVLTDDELTCIAEANKRPWALPLGGDRDADAVTASALSGERSLFARGLLGPRDGGFALAAPAFRYVAPGLRGDPEVLLFVADDEFRWVLQGVSLAWYRSDDADVMEIRTANGLHHFTSPARENLVTALGNHLTDAFDEGFPDAASGASLALCVVAVGAGAAFHVAQGGVSRASLTGEGLSSLAWQPTSLDEAVAGLGIAGSTAAR